MWKLVQAHEINEERYDQRRAEVSFEIGDKIYVENGNKLNHSKLNEIRIGPFPVEKKVLETVFEVNVGRNKPDHRLYHVSKMIPFRVIRIDESDC